jgi:glycosyltransferase involved in cell wall biosynthesis
LRIVVATVHSPFIRGGAEIHAEELCNALRAAGHEADLVAVPFKWYPPARIMEQALACRLLDLTESEGVTIDRLIALKFPAYLIPHPNKVIWLLHQHRPAYDLWDHPLGDLIGHPDGLAVRDAIRRADRTLIPEARAVFANSKTVARRLEMYCSVEAAPLYHPPRGAEQFYCVDAGDAVGGDPFLFFPSRISPNKRQHLVVEALARTRAPVKLALASSSNHPEYLNAMMDQVAALGLGSRVSFKGEVSEEGKRWLYANALGVVYPPVDEDYGYVTLEAMLSSKAVITCTDSGGPLEFVRHDQTGLVVGPTPDELAGAMDRVWEERAVARAWGHAGRSLYDSLGISWANVVGRLLS